MNANELDEGARPRAYSIDGAARAANASRSMVYSAIWANQLRARKMGRRTVILADDLDQWLRNLPDYQRQAVEA